MAIIAYDGELKIATGWDNTAGYTVITSLTDSDSVPYALPTPFTGMTLGRRRARLSLRAYDTDNKAVVWVFPGLSMKQLDKLYDDYQAVNDAKVTIRTWFRGIGFDDFNARIVVPETIGEMLQSLTGVATYKPNSGGSHKANWLPTNIGFNIEGTAS